MFVRQKGFELICSLSQPELEALNIKVKNNRIENETEVIKNLSDLADKLIFAYYNDQPNAAYQMALYIKKFNCGAKLHIFAIKESDDVEDARTGVDEEYEDSITKARMRLLKEITWNAGLKPEDKNVHIFQDKSIEGLVKIMKDIQFDIEKELGEIYSYKNSYYLVLRRNDYNLHNSETKVSPYILREHGTLISKDMKKLLAYY